MEKQIKTIGVLTSGGDAPGMNAAVREKTAALLGLTLELEEKNLQKAHQHAKPEPDG